jgi:two-component system, CAI-1 autoinducer sensor kinase/phosphatase CqsS
MFSLLPALVSALFLGYGFYVIAEKGFNRVTTSFLVLCVTTFFWQATWAVLFQVRSPEYAQVLVKAGYLLILFLPTSLYHFLTEISGRQGERRYVFASYAAAGVLACFLVFSDLFVNGYYEYFFGYYPRAGILHPLHVLQTVVVVNRGLYITWRQQQAASSGQRSRLRLCIASLFVYFFAAVDYLANYGFEFYPPGVAFLAVSLGIISLAVIKYDLMSPVAVAATVAHEVRTPLANIRLQAVAAAQWGPELYEGYRLAVQHGLCKPTLPPEAARFMENLSRSITRQVDRSNVVIDLILASARMEEIDSGTFAPHSIRHCVNEALDGYPFTFGEKDKVNITGVGDFRFHGSETLVVYVIFNLIRNSLYAMKAAGKGDITISTSSASGWNALVITDTATGIPAQALPRIFDTFFTTKKGAGAGLGLAFCKRVMASFGGRIHCDSTEGRFTTFTLEFPPAVQDGSSPAQSAKAAPGASAGSVKSL